MSFVSISVLKHHGQRNLQKSLFQLSVPEGEESIMAGQYSHKHQLWLLEQEAETSGLSRNHKHGLEVVLSYGI